MGGGTFFKVGGTDPGPSGVLPPSGVLKLENYLLEY